MSSAVVRRITPFVRRDDGLRLVWCEAVAPGGDGGEYLSPVDVRAAATAFMAGLARGEYSWPDGLSVAQSFIAREGDPDFAAGAWMLVFELYGDAWKAVRSGEVDACAVEVHLESVEPVVYNDGGSSPVQKHLPGRHDQKTHGNRVKSVAVTLAAKAKEAESQVTSDMQAVSEAIDAPLAGLEFRLKTEESLERKMRETLDRNRKTGVAGASAKMMDTLRYTLEIPNDDYAAGLTKAVDGIREQQYEPVPERFKNYWGLEGYQGIHTNWKAPNGTVFEVQFHTPRSYEVKEKQSHPLYRKLRVLDPGSEEAIALQRQIDDLWRGVPIPPGAAELTADELGL